MNELKEDIENVLGTLVSESQKEDFFMVGISFDLYSDMIMHLIETYTTRKELEARIYSAEFIDVNGINTPFYIVNKVTLNKGE